MYVNWLMFVAYKWFIFTFTLVCVGFLQALIDPGEGTFIIICNNIMTLHINASGCMFLSLLLIAIFYSSVKLLSLLSGAWLEGTVIHFGCSALCWWMLYCALSCQTFKKVTFRGKKMECKVYSLEFYATVQFTGIYAQGCFIDWDSECNKRRIFPSLKCHVSRFNIKQASCCFSWIKAFWLVNWLSLHFKAVYLSGKM